MSESLIRGAKNRILQELARVLPGAGTLRVAIHRWRGVRIGEGSWIGYDCVLETSKPQLITIGRNVTIGLRVSLIAHFRGTEGITIEDDAFIGPGAILLPNVRIGRGAVVAAGSVVSSSVPPMTLVQGNPARPIAECGLSLSPREPVGKFYKALSPLPSRSSTRDVSSAEGPDERP